MKRFKIASALALSAIVLASSCKKFDDLGTNPKQASPEQVEVEYFLNNAIIGAQMDPHIGERAFVLYWKVASHQMLENTLNVGEDDDDWNKDYFRYISGWLNHVNTAIQVADDKKTNGTAWPHNDNMKQVARIWRAYLMSEMADNYGPIPVNGFQGTNPDFADVKTVYYHILAELKDASAKLDLNVPTPENIKAYDAAYSFSWAKWQKYANSLRLRLAMRLSQVDAPKAKAEFEDAVTKPLLTAMGDAFQVQEKSGWNDLSGVMSRPWSTLMLSATVKNLYTGLGGIKSADQLTASYAPYIKPANYAGLRLLDHFSTKTNEPYAGYWLDGLPNMIDPRGYLTFPPAGDFNNPDFAKLNNWSSTLKRLTDGTNTVRTLESAFTWNGAAGGDWGVPGSKNLWVFTSGGSPRLALKFRNDSNKRLFFAPWETYFLIAEAAVRGWTVPLTGEDAYTKGITSSFEYWGVSSKLPAYLASTNYNNDGTSVSWSHVTEPPATYAMDYVDGYTAATGSVNIKYPVNTLYKNGTVKNDLLTKIITQKYIAQMPWLPLEAWSDHRRLGLPFIETPVVENTLNNLPALTQANFMTPTVKCFPQRLRYPSSLINANAKGYEQAMTALGNGATDAITTPLWWAQK
ncbi:SusD/RagB family nutrient-binding outer membrane lipoprotein [Pseudoflavitalea sp. G-6-1-2]|uniref:SusD/RagB family nutrient-binding outer membrane lipoprotein n=1 Tax=Pseudoflavitalea sp. G-6-1-2 TaxID=2728841 RepID=UPI00146CB52B|nr:SusD/RagB family nutrient-binding outer membrane lipoprotein [Pseudoflavitalea sp. G-6-1-2]NML20820.1 SusD/RagB family nutrient-binding outer membrane lipoprotein [Pseudoflavitalea sp. G-6-1-2]